MAPFFSINPARALFDKAKAFAYNTMQPCDTK
jgi:hypothetical protein